MRPARAPARWRRQATAAMAGALLVAIACSESGTATTPTPTPPPVVTPPAVLEVSRTGPACYIRQEPGADIPTAVKGYRLTTTRDLPAGIVPTVKSVRFAGGGDTRVLEAEVCFTADASAPEGRHEASLELRLYSVDAEKLAGNTRLAPVRVLPFTQVISVR